MKKQMKKEEEVLDRTSRLRFLIAICNHRYKYVHLSTVVEKFEDFCNKLGVDINSEFIIDSISLSAKKLNLINEVRIILDSLYNECVELNIRAMQERDNQIVKNIKELSKRCSVNA